MLLLTEVHAHLTLCCLCVLDCHSEDLLDFILEAGSSSHEVCSVDSPWSLCSNYPWAARTDGPRFSLMSVAIMDVPLGRGAAELVPS